MLSSGASWHATCAGFANFNIQCSSDVVCHTHSGCKVSLQFSNNYFSISFQYYVIIVTMMMMMMNDDEVDDDDDDDGDDDNFYYKAIIEINLMARSADMLIVVA